MARPINTAWFETFIEAEKIFKARGANCNVTTIAAELDINKKLLSRMVAAGKFLRSVLPKATKSQVRCSYVHFETLEKISRFSPRTAKSLADKALSNAVSIEELRLTLESFRKKNPDASPLQIARANNRRSSLRFYSDVDACMASNSSEMFGVHGGDIVLVKNSPLYEGPRHLVLDKDGDLYAQVICKCAGESKDPLLIAMSLYDLAKARRIDTLLAKVWIVLPKDSEVLPLLAEISVQGQAFALGRDWLNLGYVTKKQDSAGLWLHTFSDDEYSDAFRRVTEGKSRVSADLLAPRFKTKLSNRSTLPIPLLFQEK